MSEQPVYTASVFTREVHYTNFKGETRKAELSFALDPLSLLEVVSKIDLKKPQNRSGNPQRRNAEPEMTDEAQVKFIRQLAVRAAGSPSDDGESWEPYHYFEDTLAGSAFLVKLASSDADRKEFAQKVMLDPFRAFITFAHADESNSPDDLKQFAEMLVQMENIFKEPAEKKETLEEKKARLAAQLQELKDAEGAGE